MIIKPADYWRKSKKISKLLGLSGKVLFATNGFALVSIGAKKYEFQTVAGSKLNTGDKIVTVFRRLNLENNSSLVGYTLKVKKI